MTNSNAHTNPAATAAVLTSTMPPALDGQAAKYKRLEDAAKLYGVSARTMRRWIAQGMIRASKVSRQLLLVDLSSVDRMLAEAANRGQASA